MRQALRIADIVETEAALHAQAVLVRRAIPAGHRYQLVVLDLVGELAADPAIGADAVHLAIGKFSADILRVHQRRRHQRASRAGLHAFAAGHASRRAHRIVEVEHDLLGMAAAGHADDVVDLHLAAGADAEIALDAGVEIDRHCGVAAVGRKLLVTREAALGHVLPQRSLPELGIGIVRDLLRRLVGHEQLDHHAPRGLGAVGLGLHFHAGRRRADAACRQHALAFDLDHADAAIAVRPVAGLRRVAQMRQLDADPRRGAEDRLACADIDLAVVEQEGVRLGVVVAHRGTKIVPQSQLSSPRRRGSIVPRSM